MEQSTAKDIVGIVGLGLAAHYATEMGTGHPRDPQMEGGLTPRPALTGDLKHDVAMQGGRFATNWGIAHWILIPIWKVFAIGTVLGLWKLGLIMGITSMTLGIVVWLILQVMFIWACGRLFDGKKVKRPKSLPLMIDGQIVRSGFFRSHSRIVTTEVIDGHVVFVPVDHQLSQRHA